MDDRGLCADATVAVERYLGLVDRLLPGRVTGFYLVGSVALGDHRPGRSDIDFVGVVEGDLDRGELRRLRLVHALSGVRTAAGALARGQVTLPGTCNGVYVRAADLSRPVSRIAPVASHTGASFAVGRGFDVNPVQWATFATRGVALRGPEPATLGLDPEPASLRAWNLDNLASYWVPWAERLRRRPGVRYRSHPRWWTSWGVLGAPRLHHTVATGRVIGKDAAGGYARTTFDARWHPLIDEALAYRRGEPADPRYRDVRTRSAATAAFVLDVARAAADL
ncbi:MAG TPA: nucleotidyltransferase domain-containing protein [Acidimicrobiales bacterium]